MRGTVFDRLLRVACGHQAVNEAARKTVAATHAIENFEVGILARLIKFSAHPRDRSPIIDGGGLRRAQRRGRSLEVRVSLHRGFYHLLERGHVDMEQVFVRPFDVKPEASSETLFVAD